MTPFLQMDILKSRDILGWLAQIPHAHVTLLVDCEQSFVASYGKQREPELVEIVEDPWNMLTGLKTSTVVYFLQPDIRAMAQLRNKDVSEIAGMLTKGFIFALRHCSLRRGVELRLCHRRFYEAVSFYWHRRGRQHKAFVPAVGVSSQLFLCLCGVFPCFCVSVVCFHVFVSLWCVSVSLWCVAMFLCCHVSLPLVLCLYQLPTHSGRCQPRILREEAASI